MGGEVDVIWHRVISIAIPSTAEPASLPVSASQPFKAKIKSNRFGAQRLINLEIPVLVRSLKSSNIELG